VSSQPEWSVKQAVPEDAEAIAFLHAESFKAAYLGVDEERDARVLAEAAAFMTADRLEKRMKLILESMVHSDKEYYAVVNNEHGLPAGFIHGLKEADRQELRALYIRTAYYGSGVAQALTREFINWCDPDKPIELGVVLENERAQNFYKKIGFQATGRSRDSFYDYLPETEMILSKRQGDKDEV